MSKTRPPKDRAPYLSAGEIETSIRLLADVHEARALELDAIGWTGKAKLVRACLGALEEVSRTCKLRCCPTCHAVLARGRQREAALVIKRMKRPELLLITLPTDTLHDLRPTLHQLRRLLRELRRTQLAKIESAIGNIEPKLARDRHRWAVHVHLIVDARGVDLQKAQRAWSALSSGRGALHVDSVVFRRFVNSDNPFALAAYTFKGDDVCPAPGTMAPELLKILWSSTHGQQLPVRWGGKRGRVPAADGRHGRLAAAVMRAR